PRTVVILTHRSARPRKRPVSLLQPDLRRLDDRDPALRALADEVAHLLRRGPARVDVERRNTPVHLRFPEALPDGVRELFRDLLRSPGRRHDAHPGIRLEAGQGLANRRHLGERREAIMTR